MKGYNLLKVLEKLKRRNSDREWLYLDGGMGTMLQKAGLPTGAIPELLNIEDPQKIIDVHRAYIEAGSDIIYANTFGANGKKLKNTKYTTKDIITSAIKNARIACGDTNALVALDLGPIGQMLEPLGTLTFEEAYSIFKEQVEAGKDADLIVIETMTDLYETRAAVLAAKENSDKPVFVTMTFEPNMRTFTGCNISAMALTLEGLGVDAIGVNCSLGPKELYPVVEELCKWTSLPVIVKPNAGLPDPVTGEFHVLPDEFAEAMGEFSKLGIAVFGGCCGTTPEHMKKAFEYLEEKCSFIDRETNIPPAICSASVTLPITEPRVIGERINPTGKKRFQAALRENDMGYILEQAAQQIDAGADLLDVNVGLPGIDEKEQMIRTVKAIQGMTDIPLQLDSTIPEVLEAGLRVYNGKPIVNSVNGEKASLEKILPIVKKYGACVIGLTLDENGIPKKADDRFAIAKRILDAAVAIGIPKNNVFIDCLTLTASAEQAGVVETLKAVKRVKTELGLKTALGVSNISFGLPNREAVNRTFLTLALENGLDLPIINPNIASMMEAVRAYKLLRGIDENSVAFIEAYSSDMNSGKVKPDLNAGKTEMTLEYAMTHGLKEECGKIASKLLETTEPMDIIDNMLIPILDETGKQFEAGKVFLPQLIQTAGTAQAVFAVIKDTLIKQNAAPVSRGKVVMATVKGDIHDIGKNIVKVILENYGYTVIDLGRDVPCQTVVDAAIEHKVKLVGLSALMTTTLGAMEETIRLLNEQYPECKTVVGGAVLTPEYAKSISADFYAKDAMDTVAAAKEVIG